MVTPLIVRVRPLWNLMSALLIFAMLGLPLVDVALAAIRRFPRWAFAYLGQVLGIVVFATSQMRNLTVLVLAPALLGAVRGALRLRAA